MADARITLSLRLVDEDEIEKKIAAVKASLDEAKELLKELSSKEFEIEISSSQ